VAQTSVVGTEAAIVVAIPWREDASSEGDGEDKKNKDVFHVGFSFE
jgi:hypothetical protein